MGFFAGPVGWPIGKGQNPPGLFGGIVRSVAIAKGLAVTGGGESEQVAPVGQFLQIKYCNALLIGWQNPSPPAAIVVRVLPQMHGGIADGRAVQGITVVGQDLPALCFQDQRGVTDQNQLSGGCLVSRSG